MTLLETTLRGKCLADAGHVLSNALVDHNFLPRDDLDVEAWRWILADWAATFGVNSQQAADLVVRVDGFVTVCLTSVASDLRHCPVWVDGDGLVA